jgi:hypothetical protein
VHEKMIEDEQYVPAERYCACFVCRWVVTFLHVRDACFQDKLEDFVHC